MKKSFKSLLVLLAVVMFGFASAQNITGKSSKISVDGTSPMHDWTMTSSASNFNGTVSGNSITNVKFSMPVKNLKSAKGKMMDNKAYEALKADKHSNVTFSAATLNVGKSNVTGKMTIGGVTKDVSFPVTVTKNGASYHIVGTENLKLSTFGLARPGFMGVKTGDDLKVTVNITAN